MRVQALPGFRDFFPEEAAQRNHIFSAWRSVARRFAFEEYDGPPLEALQLYTEKSGPEIVEQLYSFTDKGEREVALRPEMTPTLARMVGSRAQGLKKPVRWFAIPQLFRYERQQRGRLREHFQFNVDVLGEPGPLADAEVIAVAVEVLRELGLGPQDFRVRLSDRRVVAALLESVGVGDDLTSLALAAIDKVEREDRATLVKRLTDGGLASGAANGVLDIAALKGEEAVMDRLRSDADPDVAAPLLECVAALRSMGLGEFLDVDLTIVRGLAYYTGIVFELFDAAGDLRAICGGGRYDNLLENLGGQDMPAVGFGMGDVVLQELLKDRGLLASPESAAEVFVVNVSEAQRDEVLDIATRLRRSGVATEYSLKSVAVGKQMKLASARGAKLVLVVGPDEVDKRMIVVRDMRDGSESEVEMESVAEKVHGMLEQETTRAD